MSNNINKRGTFRYATSEFWMSDTTKRILDNYDPSMHAFYVRGLIKKAVEDFIRIINNGDSSVTVTYSSEGNGESFAAGNAIEHKKVRVQSDIFDLDVTVGLALHEAMHVRDSILLCSSELFQEFLLTRDIDNLVGRTIRMIVGDYVDFIAAKLGMDYGMIAEKMTGESCLYSILLDKVAGAITAHTTKTNLDSMFNSDGYKRMRNAYERVSKLNNGAALLKKIAPVMNGIRNWIEDRRIDNKASVIAPGYVGYYDALYDKYFFSKNMREIVKNNITNEPSLKHYDLYICNLWESQKYVNEVPALGDIVKAIDLPNIGRLEDSLDAITLTAEVMAIILEEMLTRKSRKQQQKAQPQQKQPKLGNSNEGTNQDDNDEDGDSSEDESADNGEDGPTKESNSNSEGSNDSEDSTEGDNSTEGKDGETEESKPSAGGNEFGDESEDDEEDDGTRPDAGNVNADDFDESNNEDNTTEDNNSADGTEDANSEPTDDYTGNDESTEHNDDNGDEVEHTDNNEIGDATAEDTTNDNASEEESPEVNDGENTAGVTGDDDSALADEENSIDDDAEDMLDEQKGFMEGDIERSDVTDMEEQIIEATATGDIELRVSKDGAESIATYVCKKFNMQSIDILKELCTNVGTYTKEDSEAQRNILKALKYGEKLAHLIQIRNEERSLVNPSQKSGKVFKRHLYKIAGDNDKVFYNVISENFNPVVMHISIDASGSMSGERFDNAVYMAVALAVVADKTKNVEVVISFRGESRNGYSGAGIGRVSNSRGAELPFMLVAYDSRVDKLSKIRQMFRFIHPNSGTPEGLCFAAILEELIEYSKGSTAYFINISDGMPSFSGYGGEPALKHTKKQVDKIRKAGIKVMSFFIGSEYSMGNFKFMYGKDAKNIDVTNLKKLAASINQMLLEK